MKAGNKQRFGLAVGVISLIAAIVHLELIFWSSRFPLLALGPMLFCGALVAFAHGSLRIALVTAVLALCGSALAATRTATLQDWQIALFLVAAVTVFLLGGLLMMNYRSTRNRAAKSDLPVWLVLAQRKLGVTAGSISLTMGLSAWLGMGLAYCMAHNLHLLEEQVPLEGDPYFLAPLAFLGG